MVPASTMKILTALAAIERWGLEHRFHTDFYLGNDNRLWVKGYGDPYLVSEELHLIAKALKARGVRKVAGIGTDDSYFDPNLAISGRSSSDNPYDAPVTGLAARQRYQHRWKGPERGGTNAADPHGAAVRTAIRDRRTGSTSSSGRKRYATSVNS